MKMEFAGKCPICGETLILQTGDGLTFYDCPKDHFCGVAPSSMQQDQMLAFDLEIHTGNLCPICSMLLKIEGRQSWCESSEHLYSRQAPSKAEEHPYRGPEWYVWLGKNNLVPQEEYERSIAGKENPDVS